MDIALKQLVSQLNKSAFEQVLREQKINTLKVFVFGEEGD